MPFFFGPHPRPLPKKGGEWCSVKHNTMINRRMAYSHKPPPFLFGEGGRGDGVSWQEW